MAFDGIFLNKVIDELSIAQNAHIDKIYQPSKDELVFSLRKKDLNKKIICSVRSGATRVHFTENKYENPQTPPMFCMLLRKHLSGAKLIKIHKPINDRICEFLFYATDEMGDKTELKLVLELVSSKANIVLVGKNGKIIDSLRRSDLESGGRLNWPGALYEYPEPQNKLLPVKENLNKYLLLLSENSSSSVEKAILNIFSGFSPLICREIAYLTKTEETLCGNLTENQRLEIFNSVLKTVEDSTPFELVKDGAPYDYTYTNIKQYGNFVTANTFNSFSELLDNFYYEREQKARIAAVGHNVIKLVTNLTERANRRLNLRQKDLENSENRENLRIYGELIKANLYRIETGDTSVVVENYYDDMKEVKIKLNPALSPANNAAKYFKEYKKTCNAVQYLNELIESDRKELEYLESVMVNISKCSSISEFSEIKEELFSAGYIKRPTQKKPKKVTFSDFREYVSPSGYKVLVGKNNNQNDYLTTKLSSKQDVWFHTKNIAGSHTVVFCGGEPLSEEDILFAARLAATFSKASNSTNVPVDYTPIKYVKKPAKAKPGMVIYTTNKTVFVTP